jgi:outer membrane protein assembly factor BamE
MILALIAPDNRARRMRLLFWLLVAVPLVAACNPLTALSVYRMEVQQGNYISQEAVAQLKLGMTKEQVRFVLGTPLVADIFHENRWDYVYRRQRENSRQVEERRVSVFFDGDKLVRLEGDVMPSRGGASAARDADTAARDADSAPRDAK